MNVTRNRPLLRLWALLLALVLVLTGCSASDSGQKGRKNEELPLVSDGASAFRIICAAGCVEETTDAAVSLQKEIARLTGVSLEVCEDMAYTPSEEDWEILVGSSDREEDDLTYGSIERVGDYLVCVQGRKLTIAAAKNESMTAAVQALCLVLGDYYNDGVLLLPADFLLSGTTGQGLAAGLPAFGGGSFLAEADGGNGTELLIYQANSSECDQYCRKLESAGYTLHTKNEIDGNRYFTYVGSGVTVTVMDHPKLGTVRISVDPEEYRLATGAEEIDAVVTPSVTLLGLEGYETSGNPTQTGLSMLYQLSDGSFIVVDGGHNKIQASLPLYQTMQKLAPDPNNITIAAWLITHSHNDHAGAFLSFRRNYGSQVTLEKLLVSFPGDGQYKASGTGTSYKTGVLEEAAYYDGVEVIKVHPGQVLYLRDAVLEVLYTLDLYEPATLTDFNDTSIVCTVTLGGQKLLQTGDCGVVTSGILTKLYDEALQCQILQMSHHGYQGGTEELYQAVDPLYVLWPSGTNTYNNYRNAANNTWLMNESRMQQMWLAGDDIQTLALPIGG